jgi:hypothetical protein
MTGLVHTQRVAGIASERWPASVRNRGRLQIGIPAGIKSEYPAGLNRNPHPITVESAKSLASREGISTIYVDERFQESHR